ncbi:MAG TPA: glutaredoxin domain-containing protein [Baekduia sp.]|nr:glutaredoxin domain-containing protein [Baekduia sp.]
MAAVTVYTTDPCSFCLRAKQLLDARGIEYDEVNLAKDPTGRSELLERTGMMSFPQVLVGDELIGGFQETIAADRSGRLAELLKAAA